MFDEKSNWQGKEQLNDRESGDNDDSRNLPLSRRLFVGGTLLGLAGTVPTAISSAADAGATAVSSGPWSDPATWGGSVPTADDDVFVEQGVTVTVDGETPRLGQVDVAGTLRFDPSTDTHLRADTLLNQENGLIEMGTAAQPISPDVEARVTFIDRGSIDNGNTNAFEQGRGILVLGDWVVHGAEKKTWTTLANHPTAGDDALDLSESPSNWQVGDELVVPGVSPSDDEDEERTVAAVDEGSNTVELDSALEFDHVPPKSDLDAYALNLTRNVVFTSESAEIDRRGHAMVMSTATDVRYATFDEMGRTDKSRPISNPVRGTSPEDANVSARYPFHYHITGIGAEPHYAEGLVATNSPGWGFVNHHAHADFVDCVTYKIDGAGFVSEGGNERGSFKRNFALRSNGSGETIDSRAAGAHGGDPAIDDFGHAGHGFWFQSPLTEVSDNVAAGHRHQAFVWWLRPILEGIEAEGSSIEDSRVTNTPNLPVEFADIDRPLWEAIEEGRFSNGRNNDLMVDTQKIPSTFANLATVTGNTAFASAGGVDYSRQNFKWKHERFSDFNTIDDLTVYNIGKFVDAAGETHGYSLPRHRDAGHQGRGGGCGVSFRYTSNVRLTNSRILGSGLDDTVGVPFHDYRWTVMVDNCHIEGWDWGVDSGEHRVTWVRDNTFRNNSSDVNWSLDNVGPAILDGNDLEGVRFEFERQNQKAGEVFDFDNGRGMRIDGRTVYMAEQAPDYVPFPDDGSLSGVNHLDDVFPNPSALVGMTNAEMFDAYGHCIRDTLIPQDAVTEPWLNGAYIDPTPNRATHAYANMVDASLSDGWEVVDTSDAAGGKAIRATGTESAASIEFTVGESGTYKVYLRARPDAWNGDYVDLRIDDGDWNGAGKLKPPTGFEWHDASPHKEAAYTFDLDAGTHTLELACGNDGVLVDQVLISSDAEILGAYDASNSSPAPDPEPEPDRQPYADHDLSKIQAEDFDTGGEGVAYHDTSDGNNGGAYRDTDVDIEQTSDAGGGYNVGWIEAGEWWEYTVDVPEAGEYSLKARIAGKNDTTMDVTVDGSSVATVDVPETGGWQAWETVTAGTVSLDAGTRRIRVTANGGGCNFNWFGFTVGDDSTATVAPTNLSASNVTDTSVDLAWDTGSDSESSVDHYAVYRDGTKETEVSGTSTTVGSLTADTTYTFHVTAVDDAGNESAASNQVSVTTGVAAKTVEITGDGSSNYNDGSSVRYILETSGTLESGNMLESGDMFGGAKAVGSVAADGSDTDTYKLANGEVTDVSTWGGDVTVTVDGTEL